MIRLINLSLILCILIFYCEKSVAQNYTNEAIVTFVDDDAGPGIYAIKKLADTKGIKLTFAVIATKLDINERKDSLLKYQSEGFQIVSHSKTHGEAIWRKGYSDFNMTTIEAEMKESKERLEAEGFTDCDFLVYPYGQFPDADNVKKIS